MNTEGMKTEAFDFHLPEERIALYPADPRHSARMLVVKPDDPSALADARVWDLTEYLNPGDALVVNDTRVIPAELTGVRTRGEAATTVHFTLHKRLDGRTWRAFARPAKRLKPGDRVAFDAALSASIAEKGEAGEVVLEFGLSAEELDRAIAAAGTMPLPPYIASKRPVDGADEESYQTLFAERQGAVAAPTAGLHFTPELVDRLKAHGVELHRVTLHVGAGTFLPVKTDAIADHKMHSEWGEIAEEAAAALRSVKARGNRVVAVGTTSLRILETSAQASGRISAFSGETDIFITPGYGFRAIDALMTNFHLPRSTLFMLVSALSGLKTMQAAYAHAIAAGYRFYSYGDACLLFPAKPL